MSNEKKETTREQREKILCEALERGFVIPNGYEINFDTMTLEKKD